MAHRQPRRNTLAPNTSTPSPRKLAAIAPTTAPSAAPTNRCKETGRAAPSDDCVITIVVIGAQYASGSRNSRAMNKEITATQAVRTEWIKTGQTSVFLICIGHRLARPTETLFAAPGRSSRPLALDGSMPDRRIYHRSEIAANTSPERDLPGLIGASCSRIAVAGRRGQRRLGSGVNSESATVARRRSLVLPIAANSPSTETQRRLHSPAGESK
jgi:hypothetical protein